MTTAVSTRWNTDGKWGEMLGSQRLAFIGKLIVALCTWGFVFPSILS